MNISSLKEKNRNLFLQMGEITANENKAEKENFREEVRTFLQELAEGANEIEYEEDYAWTNRALSSWHSYLRAEYSEFLRTEVLTPKKTLIRKPDSTMIIRKGRFLSGILYRVLTTEPSSGSVFTFFADFILELTQNALTIGTELKQIMVESIEIAERLRPYPLKKLVDIVVENLDDIENLRAALRYQINMKKELLPAINNSFKSGLKLVGINSEKCAVLIYGYTELLMPALEAIPIGRRKDITTYVSECQYRHRRNDGIEVVRICNKLGFQTEPVSDQTAISLLDQKKARNILMGCKAIGMKNDRMLVVNTVGSKQIAEIGTKRNLNVCFLAGTYKIFGRKMFQKEYEKIENEPIDELEIGLFESEAQEQPAKNSDIISSENITYVVTEHGMFDSQAFIRQYSNELS